MFTTPTAATDLSDASLTRSITTAHRSLTRHKAAFIITLTEFDERGLARRKGAANTADWAVRTQDLSRRSAQEYLQIGRRLRLFLLLAGEFLSGDLSYSKVRLLLRYMTTENEAELIALARAHSLTELEELLAGRDKVTGITKARNRLSVTVDSETGGVRFWGALDPERGAEFLAALKTAELSQLGEGEESPSAGTRFGAPVASSLIGAFSTMIHMVRHHPHSRPTAPGAQVNVILTADNRAYIPGHHGGQTGDILRSVLHGSVAVHLLDARGRHLKLSRTARLVNAAQEKALLTRWNHRCSCPSCGHTRWLEFHHIRPWSEGGETELDNLVPLCPTHHVMVEEGDLVIVHDEVDPTLLRFRFRDGESWTATDGQPPVRNEEMGQWSDGYLHGPVPLGDEHLLNIWEHEDSFDDAAGQEG